MERYGCSGETASTGIRLCIFCAFTAHRNRTYVPQITAQGKTVQITVNSSKKSKACNQRLFNRMGIHYWSCESWAPTCMPRRQEAPKKPHCTPEHSTISSSRKFWELDLPLRVHTRFDSTVSWSTATGCEYGHV